MEFGSARRLRFALALLLSAALAAAFAAPGAAQGPAPEGDAHEQSTIRVGDVVAITVYGDPELSVEAPVLPDGTIYYPFAGSVRVAGKSQAEVAEEIEAVLAEYVREPEVTVTVRPGKGPTVAVLGEVRSPGLYTLPSGEGSLAEVLAQAGGTLVTADLAGVRVYDGGSILDYREAPIGSDRVLFEGEASENPRVYAGNVVYVPRAKIEVAVLGEVRSPGLYPLSSSPARLLELIAAAGGPLATADLAGVRIYEGGSVVDYREAPIGADRVLFEGEVSENPEVRPGSVIYVPRGTIDVSAMGLVARPGTFEVEKGATLLDLISLAGGLTPEADPSSLVLRRRSGAGEPERLVFDLQSLLSGSVPDHVLQDGDLLYVQPAIRVYVAGEVRNNGVFRLASNSRLTDAILAAGGVTPDADMNRVTVSRSSGGVQELLEVDYERVLSGGAENILMRDGDIVNVPRGVNWVYVAGEVRSPGAYRVLPGSRLIDAVYAAGGPTADGEVEEVYIFAAPQPGQPPRRFDLEELESTGLGRTVFTGPLELNPPVEPGQTVYVPKKNIEIFVLGAVRTPGLIEVRRGSTILDVAAAVGGPNQEGDWRNVQLLRREAYTAEAFDVLALLETPEAAAGIVLDEGDALYVPENVVRVSVLGDVSRPGTYTLTRSSRVVDALAAAGGATERAALERVNVILNTEESGPLEVRLGQNDRLLPDEEALSMPIEDGAVVVVPESRGIDWEKVVTVLTGVKLVLDLVDWLR